MTTPRIEEIEQEFEDMFIHGLSDVNVLRNWLRKALTEAHQAGIDEAVKRIIYMTTSNKDAYMMPVTEERWLRDLQALQDNK